MISLKAGPTGARVGGIRGESLIAIMVASSVYDKFSQPFMVTAVTDSNHSPGSLHYVGLAIDIGLPSETTKASIVANLKSSLADDYDVVLESNHIHIEFQPKRGLNL